MLRPAREGRSILGRGELAGARAGELMWRGEEGQLVLCSGVSSLSCGEEYIRRKKEIREDKVLSKYRRC